MQWFVNTADGRIIDADGVRAEVYSNSPSWCAVSEDEARRLKADREAVLAKLSDLAASREAARRAPRPDKIRLSVALMTHPSRRHLQDRLMSMLDQPERVRVFSDDHSEGCWPNARRAWSAFDPKATHHLVLQEDAYPCRDFVASAEECLRHVPDQLVSFMGRRVWGDSSAVEEADRVRVHWGTSDVVATGQATCMPTCWVPEWLRFCEEHVIERCPVDDMRLDLWLLVTRRLAWFPFPSLIEHLDNMQTLIWGKTFSAPRLAYRFIGANVSGLSVDWSIGADKPAYYRIPDAHRKYSIWYKQ